MDLGELTLKERTRAKKELMKKIEQYNKEARTKRPSFPITNPTKDLVYKGVLKISYDRGYAMQTKSLLLEGSSTAAEVVCQLFEALGLRGNPEDYALEERNIVTGEARLLKSEEAPLRLQLNYGVHRDFIEIRLVQVSDSYSAPMLSLAKGSRNNLDSGSDSDETVQDEDTRAVPKEEVNDHGIAKLDLVMEEALQDIPPLVQEIQERLRILSEMVAHDGKPRGGLPSRKALWDMLKPQASAFVKDIRRLVDSGDFLANKHCSSPVVKLIVTLLFELITDHSRELVSITKEMCALRGAAKTDFNTSVASFIQQITYISKLIGKTNDTLHAMALTSHLLAEAVPSDVAEGQLQPNSCFSGSGSVSGILIFTVVSAYLGLIRAAYEEKRDHYGSLADNMMKSAQKAMKTVQSTEEYTLLHLHPLRTRVKDMEQKLKIAMENLSRGVRVASSSRPPPDVAPEMLLLGYQVVIATLDLLMVAQIASLLHKVIIQGWELAQFPWIKSIMDPDAAWAEYSSSPEKHSTFPDYLSSISDSASSSGTADSTRRDERSRGEHRKSRLKQDSTETVESAAITMPVDDEDTTQPTQGDNDEPNQLATTKDGARSQTSPHLSDVEDQVEREEEATEIAEPSSAPEHVTPDPPAPELLTSASLKKAPRVKKRAGDALDQVKRLRLQYYINKAIARVTESLLLTVTQKLNTLTMACKEGSKARYGSTVQLMVEAAKQIQDEVAMLEEDLVVGKKMRRKDAVQLESTIRDVQLATLMATSPQAQENTVMKLLAAGGLLKEVCSQTVAEVLSTTVEYKKALEQAQQRVDEYMTLMTGKKAEPTCQPPSLGEESTARTAVKFSAAKDIEADALVFEEVAPANPVNTRGWATKEVAKVIGGSPQQLVLRLTSNRFIDPEFSTVFILTFHCFMTPEQLIDALIIRYGTQAPSDLSSWEVESFERDIAIPLRLRVVQCLSSWLTNAYDDFHNEKVVGKLKYFIQSIEETMGCSAARLRQLLHQNQTTGPLFINSKSRGQAPPPLVPLSVAHNEGKFDLLEINTLELARQLSLAYHELFKQLRPDELTCPDKSEQSPHVGAILMTTKNLSVLVHEEVIHESSEEDQASIISYFIQTAKSCQELKNYEAAFAILSGLQSVPEQEAGGAMFFVTEQLQSVYRELRELSSSDMNYHRYRQEIRPLQQSATVPHLRVILADMQAIHKDNLDTIGNKEGVVNFQKCRLFAKVLQQLQKYQSVPYNLQPIQAIQEYLGRLKHELSSEEMHRLSTKPE